MKAMTKSKQHGFSLIELMIVTAIIRVLVAVALPAHDLYRNRARFSEAILSIVYYRAAIIAQAQTDQFSSLACAKTMLDRLATYKEKSDALKAKIK